jgi:hypothetical protein
MRTLAARLMDNLKLDRVFERPSCVTLSSGQRLSVSQRVGVAISGVQERRNFAGDKRILNRAMLRSKSISFLNSRFFRLLALWRGFTSGRGLCQPFVRSKSRRRVGNEVVIGGRPPKKQRFQ